MILNRNLYNKLKFVAQILLPALGTLYVALAGLWGLPAADSVAGTVLAVDTALGALLHLSSMAYDKSDAKYDGTMKVMPTPEGGKTFSLELNGEPEDLENQDEVAFKVKQIDKVVIGEQEWNARH